MEQTGFNIYEHEPTNEDINISFNPEPTCTSYKLTILKDNAEYKEIRRINTQKIEFTLSETGIYQINVTYYDELNNETYLNSGIYTIDKEAPVIKVHKNYYELALGKKFNVMEEVIATDNMDKNITGKVTSNINEINLNEKGMKKITYYVSDTAGNKTQKDITLNITYTSTSVYIFQTIFAILLFTIALCIYVYGKSVEL